jgi:hypothetical protein
MVFCKSKSQRVGILDRACPGRLFVGKKPDNISIVNFSTLAILAFVSE